MINKTIFRGIQNLFLSKTNKFDLFSNYFSAFFKTPLATHPLEIQVEPSAICNLKCRMCSLNKSTGNKKFLTPQDLVVIIDKFKPNSINLTGMGETLLNPHFEKLLKICFDRKIKTSFITNLQLLNSHHLIAIKKYPPTTISISMESGYQKKYNLIRNGANLKITHQKIKELVTFINKNSLNTQVIINIVYLNFNLKDIKHLKKIIGLASKLGISKITSQNINRLSPYIKSLYKSQKIKNIFNEIEYYSQSKKIDLILPSSTISQNKCFYPWVYPQITATGEILPCCLIPQFGNYDQIIKKYTFGNILHNSLNNTWNSQKAKKFRLLHPNLSPCHYCSKNQGVL